jgi:aminopeptidase Y
VADKYAANKCSRLQNVLYNFNKIASDNGGNRAAGLPGYNASVNFVLERVKTRFGDQLNSYVEPFKFNFTQVRQIKVTGPGGENVYAVALTFNPSTPLPGGITGELVDTRVDDTRGR